MKNDDEGFAKKNCNDIFQPFIFDSANCIIDAPDNHDA